MDYNGDLKLNNRVILIEFLQDIANKCTCLGYRFLKL